MGYIISIMNNKGGVGKTTIACNLADSLGKGKNGNRVLVVDADPQSNASAILLPKSMHIRKSLYDVLDNGLEPDFKSGHIYPTDYKNVFVLPNIGDTASLEPYLIANAPKSLMKLRDTLRKSITNDFDYVFIDCPPNMGTFVLCALYASDFAIVPIRAKSSFSVDGLLKALSLIDDIQNKVNPDLRFLRLLINGIDNRTSISRSITDQVNRIFAEDQIFKTRIPTNTPFERAESFRATVFKHEPTSVGARAFRELSRELKSIIKGMEEWQSPKRT